MYPILKFVFSKLFLRFHVVNVVLSILIVNARCPRPSRACSVHGSTAKAELAAIGEGEKRRFPLGNFDLSALGPLGTEANFALALLCRTKVLKQMAKSRRMIASKQPRRAQQTATPQSTRPSISPKMPNCTPSTQLSISQITFHSSLQGSPLFLEVRIMDHLN